MRLGDARCGRPDSSRVRGAATAGAGEVGAAETIQALQGPLSGCQESLRGQGEEVGLSW